MAENKGDEIVFRGQQLYSVRDGKVSLLPETGNSPIFQLAVSDRGVAELFEKLLVQARMTNAYLAHMSGETLKEQDFVS